MARRRYITTEISVDDRVTELAEANLLVPLLYTWMIPHAEDDATLRGTPRQITLKVLPGIPVTTQQVEDALSVMASAGLIEWERELGVIGFPPASFYRYQTNVPTPKRRTAPLAEYLRQLPELQQVSAYQRASAQNAEEQHTTAQTSASPSPSPSPSVPDVVVVRAREAEPVDNSAEGAIEREVSEGDVSMVVTEYGRAFVKFVTPIVSDQIVDWLKRFPPELIIEALRRTAAGSTNTWAYCQGILRNWDEAHVRTVADLGVLDEAFKANRGKGRAAPTPTPPEPPPPKRIEYDPAELARLQAEAAAATERLQKRMEEAST